MRFNLNAKFLGIPEKWDPGRGTLYRDPGRGTLIVGPGTRDHWSGTRDPGPLERDPGPGALNLICGTLQSSKILQTRNAVYGHDNNGLNKHKPQWKELRIFLLFLWTLPGSDNRWY